MGIINYTVIGRTRSSRRKPTAKLNNVHTEHERKKEKNNKFGILAFSRWRVNRRRKSRLIGVRAQSWDAAATAQRNDIWEEN